MSTFKIDVPKLLDRLIPEFKWDALDSPRYEEIFGRLQSIELHGDKIIESLKKRKPRIGFHKQYKSGGGWTVFGNITLTPKEDPLKPYALSLILHEMFHIRQSLLMRLSVQGELRAWQYQQRTYPEISIPKGKRIGVKGEAYGEAADTSEFWDQLSRLSPDSREDLEKAQSVMRQIAYGYRSNSLPLYPLPQELGFYLRQGRIKDAIDTILKLFNAASEEG
jgi:hypothetical protein